ncbi:MAG: pyridoxine 5'-phosphate synthase [Candidatus Symbiodolus clandestinus]
MVQCRLGVNIDHIATLRNLRGTLYPDPLQALFIAEQAGADSITIHLREDRRHITDRDVQRIREVVQTRLNLEMAATEEMVAIARQIRPNQCCLVPERRQEQTTECGLAVDRQQKKIQQVVTQLAEVGIAVSLFIDADQRQVDAALATGATAIELHTGPYVESSSVQQKAILQQLATVADYAASRGLQVNAGHGLHYHNVQPIAALPKLYELNIGHAIIARAVMQGLGPAVAEMKRLIQEAVAGWQS